MGIIHKEKGESGLAKEYLRKAISRLTKDYTRPRDCEPLYHLGVILKNEGNYDAAVDTLYRAAWDYEFRSPSYFQLAQLYSLQEKYDKALEAVEESLLVNAMNINALCLKTSLLRHTGNHELAEKVAKKIIGIDALNKYAVNELRMIYAQQDEMDAAGKNERVLKQLLRDYPENYLELAVDYMNSGLVTEATAVLQFARASDIPGLSDYPIIHYYLGYMHHLAGESQLAREEFQHGMSLPVDYCFPFRLETLHVLKKAIEYQPDDGKAYYYQGNILFDKQPDKAIKSWEKAAIREPALAIVYRNLGFGYDHYAGDIDKAISAYETALSNDKTQPKYYAELDRLYERRGDPLEKRLEWLTTNHELLAGRQDGLMQEIKVLVNTGNFDRAIDLMDKTYFYRQEGSEPLHDLHVTANILRAKEFLAEGDYEKALGKMLRADTYPENQMIGRDTAYSRNPQIYYYTGLVYDRQGNKKQAKKYYNKAIKSTGKDTENQYYRAVAYLNLKQDKEAEALLEGIIKIGEERLESSGEVDFFAKFGDDQTDHQRMASAYYLLGLAYMGRSENSLAKDYFEKSASLDVNQLWARVYLEELTSDK